MSKHAEDRTANEWIFEILSDIYKFAQRNGLDDLAGDLKMLNKKHFPNKVCDFANRMPPTETDQDKG